MIKNIIIHTCACIRINQLVQSSIWDSCYSSDNPILVTVVPDTNYFIKTWIGMLNCQIVC